MNWIVKIGNKPKERILVEYNPITRFLHARGEYKIREIWTAMSLNEVDVDTMDLEKIQKLLGDTVVELEKRIEVYEDLDKTFKAIGQIETENIVESNGETKNSSPYVNIM